MPKSLPPRRRATLRGERASASWNFCVWHFSNTEAPRRLQILYFGPSSIRDFEISIYRHLNTAGFRGARSVVRHRSHVFDGGNLDAFCRECADRRLASGADAGDDDGNVFYSHSGGALTDELADFGSRKRRALFSAGKSKRSRGRPCDNVAGLVAEAYFGVIKSRFHIQDAGIKLALSGARRRRRAGCPFVVAFFNYSFLS